MVPPRQDLASTIEVYVPPNWCFRSLLLLGCPHLLLTKALVPDLKPATIGEVKFTTKVFQSNALQYFYQQLMAEAPVAGR